MRAIANEVQRSRSIADEVRAGLSAQPKTLPPKLFYDAAGSQLFEEITRLPEYYLTRTETCILRAQAPIHGDGGGSAAPASSNWAPARQPRRA